MQPQQYAGYWRHLIGTGMVLISMLVCLGVFAVGYLPGFPKLPLPQQITIAAATVFNILFVLAILALFLSSVIWERPHRRPAEIRDQS